MPAPCRARYAPPGMVLPAELARDFSRFAGYDGPHDDVALRRFLAAAGPELGRLVEHGVRSGYTATRNVARHRGPTVKELAP